ncbi:ras-associated and pleckstrin homology domains-containing protein 1-like isoform X2 [Asterias amurensis]|uniref:ras-associated and pleckstrin homology domains-containing protein 1-like isoform X2 n=2 Tax=Asterias amurensis TaxID=7602 RepID=UPI003AB4DCFA
MASEEDKNLEDKTVDQDNLSDHSGGDMDAELDSDQEQDLDKMLGTWLGELEIMTKNLDSTIAETPTSPTPPAPAVNDLDNFQFSMLNLEVARNNDTNSQDSPDVDLDALLGDLCQMEQSLNAQMDSCDANSNANSNSIPHFPSYNYTSSTDAASITQPPPVIHTVPATPPSFVPSPPSFTPDDTLPPPPTPTSSNEIVDQMPLPPPPSADTPDSEPSTPPPPPQQMVIPPPPSVVTAPPTSQKTPPESLAIQTREGVSPAKDFSPLKPSFLSPRSPLGQQTPYSMSVRVKLQDFEAQLASDSTLTEEEKASKLKAEKIKIALEKLKKARVQKLIIRVYGDDGSSKTMFADETMTCRQVVHILVEKNHLDERADWAVVEQIPDLYMERVLEDQEHLVTDILLHWKRDSTSRLLFTERREKYAVFRNPQNFLLSTHTSQVATEFAEKSKQTLIDEFFSEGRQGVPEIEGPLYLKAEGKKSWKKYFFILRASGIYYTPKGKSKSSKDLVCLVQFEHVNVYSGIGWKKKFKAPSDHCFALKHPQIQQKSKYIKYLSAEDYRTCQRWMAGIRIAKYGRVMLDNYIETQREMVDYSSSIESMSTSSLGDSSSISSMHSSVSNHSTQSSLGSGVSPSGSTLSVPPMQASINPARQGSMGNMFASAWKKGREKESQVDSPNMDRYNSPAQGERIPDEGTFQFKPPLVKPSQPPTQPSQPKDSPIDNDMERTLMELEMNLARDQESAQQVLAPQVSLPPSIKTNLNNSNARPVHVKVTARNSDAVTVKVTPQPSNGGTRHEPRSCPPPTAPKPHTTTTTPCISSTNQISPSAETNLKQTSSIISSRPRETNLVRSESKRVQFKEVLEENIPVRGRAAEKEPIASPPNSPLKPILNTTPAPPSSPHPTSTFSPLSSPSQPLHSASNTFHSTFSSPHTTNINKTHQPASGGLTNMVRQPRALPVMPPQSNGYGHVQQATPQQAPPRTTRVELTNQRGHQHVPWSRMQYSI